MISLNSEQHCSEAAIFCTHRAVMMHEEMRSSLTLFLTSYTLLCTEVDDLYTVNQRASSEQ